MIGEKNGRGDRKELKAGVGWLKCDVKLKR